MLQSVLYFTGDYLRQYWLTTYLDYLLYNHENKNSTDSIHLAYLEQIDNIYINEMSSGLTHAVEKMKEYAITGHVTLKKGERSQVATLAAKVL